MIRAYLDAVDPQEVPYQPVAFSMYDHTKVYMPYKP